MGKIRTLLNGLIFGVAANTSLFLYCELKANSLQLEIDRLKSKNGLEVKLQPLPRPQLSLVEFMAYNYYDWFYRTLFNFYQSDKKILLERMRKAHNI